METNGVPAVVLTAVSNVINLTKPKKLLRQCPRTQFFSFATTDIPSAFLHAPNDNYDIMHLDSILAELIAKVAPSIYCPFVTTNATGKPVLYIEIH